MGLPWGEDIGICFSRSRNGNQVGESEEIYILDYRTVHSGQFDVIMIDSINGNKLFDFDSKHFGPINSVTFHSDENIFITGGEDGYIHYWNCVDNWINLNINENLKIEYNIMNQLLIDSEILFKSLNGAEKRNQRRNLKKKIEKLKINLPIKLNEINS